MGRGAFLEHLRMGVTVQSTFMDGFEWVDVTVQKAFLKTFHFAADLVTFTEEILHGKLHFLCSDPILYNFLLVFQQAELAVMDLSIFPTIYQCFHCLQMADLIFKSRVLVFFCRNSVLVFAQLILILSVMHIQQCITVYFIAALKSFYYFKCQSNFDPCLKPSRLISWFLFVCCSWNQLFVELEFCHQLSTACKSFLPIFDSSMPEDYNYDGGRYHIETSNPNIIYKSMDWFLYDNGL